LTRACARRGPGDDQEWDEGLADLSRWSHHGTMTTATWITMVGILAFVWGGFLFALRLAVKREGAKKQDPGRDPAVP